MREDNSKTEKVIIENVDSIGYDNMYIYGFGNGQYFIVDQKSKSTRWFDNKSTLQASLNLKNALMQEAKKLLDDESRK